MPSAIYPSHRLVRPRGTLRENLMDGHVADELFQHKCVVGIVNPPVRQACNCLSPY